MTTEAPQVETYDSFLVADCGSIHTTVVLFDMVGGAYRLIARAAVPTTAHGPWFDVAQGVQQAISRISEITGRKLLSEQGRLIRPVRADGSGVDHFAAVASAAQPLDVLDWVIDDIDLVLVMSVNPGFGGQGFIDSALRKIEQARRRIEASGRDIRLEVDGGIKTGNIAQVAAAGADTFVAGSAIFGQSDYKAVIDAMRAQLAR